jgi:hypothetical protein
VASTTSGLTSSVCELKLPLPIAASLILASLAILGEGSVKANAQVSTLSLLSLVPRLLPAPQALIRTSRPESLKSDTGKVIGARSGGIRDHVNHIAHLLHNREPLANYAVRCERITKPDRDKTVTAKTFGPLAFVELLGAAMSLALVVLSIIRDDGFALCTTILLSFLSSLIGLSSRWSLELMQRKASRRVPRDNVIIKYPNGAFLIVKCDENIARELYWHPEECIYYYGATTYRIISLVGTLTLMFGVICLGNSTLFLQVGFAASYMILNAAYWVVAALPQQWHWDLSCYEVNKEIFEGEEKQSSFTMALWKAIAITESVEWVKNGQVAPVSEAWKNWVDMAGDIVDRQKERRQLAAACSDEADDDDRGSIRSLPLWDPEQALTDFLNPDEMGKNV